MTNSIDRCGQNAAAERAAEMRREAAIRAAQERAAEAKREAQQRAQAEQRQKASAEAQKAARTKFAKDPCAQPDAVKRANASDADKAKASAAQSAKKISDAANAIGKAQSEDAKRAAALKATSTLKTELQGKSDAEKQQILDASQASIQKIGAGLDKLTGDQTKRAMGDLSAATEAAGPKLASKITDPIAKSLPQELKGNGDNRGEIVDGVKDAIATGRGALFASSLNASMGKVPGLGDVANDVRKSARDAMNDASKNYADAEKKAATDDARLSVTVANWKKSGALSDGAIQAGIDAFKKAHADDYNKADAAARVLSSTLPGAAQLSKDPGITGDAARGVLKQVPELAQNDVGAKAIAQGVAQKAPFIDDAKALSAGDQKSKDAFDSAIARSVAVAGPALVKDNDRAGLSQLLQGAGDSVHDEKLRLALHEYNNRFKTFAKDVTGLALGRQLALTAKTIGNAVFGDLAKSADSKLPAGTFSGLGVVLGLGALAGDVKNFNPENARSIVTTAGHAGITALSLAELAGKETGNAGLGIGIALSAFNVGDDLVHGNVAGAGVASIPLAGAGIGALVGGPVGAGIGLAVGGLASAAISVFGSDPPRPDQIQEKEVDPFLKAALAHDHVENSDTAAFRLRDVFTQGNAFVGVGPGIAALAKQQGKTPREVLDDLARMPSDQLRDRVSAILDAERKGVLPEH